ncbi:hypothetical protein NQP46_00035 [Streptomyces albus]|nr:hypothetical protein NQP46_00035 [Streptomyces albus]
MADERLDAEWLRGWCEQADAALAKLMASFQARFGFEPGRNVVVHASEASHQATDALVELTPIPSDLTTMYWVIDEVSLPDVENGYFVHPASLVADHFREYGSVQIDGEEPALVFASDGAAICSRWRALGESGGRPPPRGSISSTLLRPVFASSSRGSLSGSVASSDGWSKGKLAQSRVRSRGLTHS